MRIRSISMRVLVLRAFGVLAILSFAAPATAEDVFFDGDVLTSCSIEGHTNGALAIDITSGGTILTSTTPPGSAGTVTIRATGSNFINVSAPTRTAQAAGYNAASEVLEVSYQGVGTLSSVSQTFTNVGTSKPATTLLAAILNVNNRITNTNGFPLGTYQTKTTVTCTPTAQF
jgi:hypothetical protein